MRTERGKGMNKDGTTGAIVHTDLKVSGKVKAIYIQTLSVFVWALTTLLRRCSFSPMSLGNKCVIGGSSLGVLDTALNPDPFGSTIRNSYLSQCISIFNRNSRNTNPRHSFSFLFFSVHELLPLSLFFLLDSW